MFSSYFFQNEADSDKVWYVFLIKFAITRCQSQTVASFQISKIKANKQNFLSFAFPALEFSQNMNFKFHKVV